VTDEVGIELSEDEAMALAPPFENLNDDVVDVGEQPVSTLVNEIIMVRPTWPLRLAVLGAPGSGKAEFIELFAAASRSFFEEHDSNLRILANGGTKIEALDQAVGFFGEYREHLMAFFLSLEEEMAARQAGDSFIVNGTVVGNLAHMAANYEQIMLGLDASGLVTPQTQVRMQQAQVGMTLLTFLMDNLQPQFVFRLPLPPYIEIPGQEQPVEKRHALRVDDALNQLIQGFQVGNQLLDEPTMEERVQVALQTVQEIAEKGVEVPKAVAVQRPLDYAEIVE